MGREFLLNDNEVDLLIEWIDRSVATGFPKNRSQIRNGAREILNLRPEKHIPDDHIPGQHWYSNFAKRHKLSFRKAKCLSKASACLTEENIKSRFAKMYDHLEKNDYTYILQHPDRLFNADEVFMRLNETGTYVVAKKGCKNVYQVSNNEKEGLTVMCGFGADGSKVSPMIIYDYLRVPLTLKNNFPKDWTMATSTRTVKYF